MGLHEHEPVLTAGEDLGDARAAAILIHGRGASAVSILTLASRLARSRDGSLTVPK
jgi:phospholipase/carboxylesterase